jgi:hypothetical protein
MTGMLRELMYLLLLPDLFIATNHELISHSVLFSFSSFLERREKVARPRRSREGGGREGLTLEEQARFLIDAFARRVGKSANLVDRVLEEGERDPEMVRVRGGRAVQVGEQELADGEILR